MHCTSRSPFGLLGADGAGEVADEVESRARSTKLSSAATGAPSSCCRRPTPVSRHAIEAASFLPSRRNWASEVRIERGDGKETVVMAPCLPGSD
jgi:hypothetical protein